MKNLIVVSVLGFVPACLGWSATDTQTVTLDHKLEIPGATLKRGAYTFEIEDRLQDRAIIRITDEKKQAHELVLAVPNEKLNHGERGKLILFPSGSSDKQILQGWMCPSCDTALEVVYPKAEAAKITGESAKPVLAVDPTYDKLPKNLTPDDMKVVTLWLLSPKEITPDQKGKGLAAAKWADVSAPKKTEVAEAKVASPVAEASSAPAPTPVSASPSAPEAPAAAPVQAPVAAPTPAPAPAAEPAPSAASTPAPASSSTSAPVASANSAGGTDSVQTAALSSPSAATHGRRMPHTASNTFNFGLFGVLFLVSGLALTVQRRIQKSDRL